MNITRIYAREVLDSRGNPTVEVEVEAGSAKGKAMVPSGASTGSHEALELRDGGNRFLGKGVSKAVSNVNKVIAPSLEGLDVTNQQKVDREMLRLDGTPNKEKLGGNAILGVSMACCRAAAKVKKVELFEYIGSLNNTKEYALPVPFMNIINGGVHANNNLSFQEYMVVPKGKNFKENLRIGSEIYQQLKKLVKERYGNTGVGDEGGFSPNMENYEEPFDLIMDAAQRLDYREDVGVAMDCAANEFYNKNYNFEGENMNREEMIEIYENLSRKYPLISIEDPLHEDDFDGYAETLKKLKGVRVVGDDLLCTNPKRIKKAIAHKSCNCLLLKLNQVGTVTEAIEAARDSRRDGWDIMVSHRSGETEDTFIADFSVGIGAKMIKSGAPCRGERTAKYNQLLRIEEKLGANAIHPHI